MILPLQEKLRAAMATALERLYGLGPGLASPIVIEYPPTRALGDLALPVAFELARRLRKAPRAIAQEIVTALEPPEGVSRVEAAATGYVNVFLDRPLLLTAALHQARSDEAARTPQDPGLKTIVEHTAINPNKAAHVGHLRNAALGDTLGRLLRFRGIPVEIQNYIDDTGVQLADVVVGFRELEGKSLSEVEQTAASTRFDFYCWDLYARVTEWYEADRARLTVRAAALHDIEHGDNETARIARFVAETIVRRHLETMGRMNVDYDLLTWERDILRLEFWARAFDILRQAGAVYLQTEGKLAGCWVMRIEEEPAGEGEEARRNETAGSASGNRDHPDRDQTATGDDSPAEDREKVIVRSDRTVTYVGKDIAYQFWKFGLLGKDFYYRPFGRRSDGATLWATSAEPSSAAIETPPSFGAATTTYNVIDTRQAYLQKLLKQALATMGYSAQAERSIHFSYEMVALSHKTAREFGYAGVEAEEDDPRPFIEVSGRKGLGVKADDLLDRLAEKADAEVSKRNPALTEAERSRTARIIAVAAVRYFMVKYSRAKLIVFDMDEALSFEGESGPYLQYAAVRAGNIFHKLKEREGLSESDLVASLPETPADNLTEGSEGDDLWGLVLEAARLDEVAEQAIRSLESAVLAKYAFGLAQAFNAFYHRYPILNEERIYVRRWRAAVASYFKAQIAQALSLMGCEVPARM